MDELLEKIRQTCAGLTADEIREQILASQWSEYIGDPDAFAAFLAAVAQAGQDPAAVAPDQDTSEEASGND